MAGQKGQRPRRATAPTAVRASGRKEAPGAHCLPTDLRAVRHGVGASVAGRQNGVCVWCRSRGQTVRGRGKKCSRSRFRSYDLWVMGPARFHCATLLVDNTFPAAIYAAGGGGGGSLVGCLREQLSRAVIGSWITS